MLWRDYTLVGGGIRCGNGRRRRGGGSCTVGRVVERTLMVGVGVGKEVVVVVVEMEQGEVWGMMKRWRWMSRGDGISVNDPRIQLP